MKKMKKMSSSATRKSMSSSASANMDMGNMVTQLFMMLLSFMAVNSIVVYAANAFFPDQVVLGNHLISPVVAAVLSGSILAVVGTAVSPMIEYFAASQKMKLSDMHWMVLYFFINVFAVWSVSRAAELAGMGIASWSVAVVLGLVLDVVQGLAVKMFMGNEK